MVKQVPSAAAVIGMAYLFLRAEEKRELRRVEDAKEKEKERRDHELQINNMWASYIKSLIDKQDETYELIAKSLSEHEKSSQERYDRIGITKDLLVAIKADQVKKKE